MTEKLAVQKTKDANKDIAEFGKKKKPIVGDADPKEKAKLQKVNSIKVEAQQRVKNEEIPKQKAKENRKVTGEKIVTKLNVRLKPIPKSV